jgi:hypothetical protein
MGLARFELAPAGVIRAPFSNYWSQLLGKSYVLARLDYNPMLDLLNLIIVKV